MGVFVDVIGWIGMVDLLIAYTLLTLGKFQGDDWRYQLMNFLGALCLAANSAYYGAIPVAILNTAWFFIGIFGFVRARRQRAKNASGAQP
jgi:hypothetical protein